MENPRCIVVYDTAEVLVEDCWFERTSGGIRIGPTRWTRLVRLFWPNYRVTTLTDCTFE